MDLFSVKNKGIVNTIHYIATRALNTASESVDKIDVENGADRKLAVSILNSYYSMEYRELLTKDSKALGVIKAKPNTVLSLIDTDKFQDSYLEFNYPLASSTTIESIGKKTGKTVSMFIEEYIPAIKRYGNKVDSYIKAMDLNINLNEEFPIKVLDFTTLLDVIVEKGIFSEVLVNSITDKVIPNINYDRELRDLELNLLVKELYETMISKDEKSDTLLKRLATLTDVESIILLLNKEGSNLEYFNAYVYLLATVNDIIADKDNLTLSEVNNYKHILNALVNNLATMNPIITRAKQVNGVIYNYSKIGNEYNIVVFGEGYREFIKSRYPKKAIYGYVLESLKQYREDITILDIVGLNKLVIDKDKYVNIIETHISNLKLTYKNNAKERIINYWIMGLTLLANESTIDNIREDLIKYLNDKTLAELSDVKNLSLDIALQTVYKDTNLGLFIELYNEAGLFNKNAAQEYLVTYATFKLILLYLANQTKVY